MDGIRAFFGAAGAEPRLVTLYVTLRVAALPAGGGFMAEQLHAAEAMRSLFPDVRFKPNPIPNPIPVPTLPSRCSATAAAANNKHPLHDYAKALEWPFCKLRSLGDRCSVAYDVPPLCKQDTPSTMLIKDEYKSILCFTHQRIFAKAGAGAGGPPCDDAAAVRAGAPQLRRRRPDDPRHLPRAPARLHELLPGACLAVMSRRAGQVTISAAARVPALLGWPPWCAACKTLLRVEQSPVVCSW